MMGSGKSTVGQCLAERLSARYVDTDGVIEGRFGRIADIFEKHGEGYFRDLETQVVKEISTQDGLVIAAGGGLVLREENVHLLKASGKIVFLRAGVQTLVNRLQGDTERPLLQTAQSLTARLEEMLKLRAPIYERVADKIVDVDGKTPQEIAEEIGRV